MIKLILFQFFFISSFMTTLDSSIRSISISFKTFGGSPIVWELNEIDRELIYLMKKYRSIPFNSSNEDHILDYFNVLDLLKREAQLMEYFKREEDSSPIQTNFEFAAKSTVGWFG